MRARRLAAALSTGLLVVLSGCAGGTSVDETGDSAVETPTATSESPEAEPSEEPSEEPAASGGGYDAEQLLAAMQGALQKAQSARMTMELVGAGQTMTGKGAISYQGKKSAMQMEISGAGLGGSMEMRLVGETVYLSIPPLTPKGKFVELDTNAAGSPFGDLSGLTENDPRSTFDGFEAGLQEVTYVGEEDVDGETLHHYRVVVDAKKAAKAQGQPAPKGVKDVSYDLWIDDRDLMRRIEFTEPDGSLTMTMDDWGKKVTVKAPPRSQLVELPPGLVPAP